MTCLKDMTIEEIRNYDGKYYGIWVHPKNLDNKSFAYELEEFIYKEYPVDKIRFVLDMEQRRQCRDVWTTKSEAEARLKELKQKGDE